MVKDVVQRWEWEGSTAPDQAELLKALDSLAPVWGVAIIDHAVHVLPMSQTPKVYYDENDVRVPKRVSTRESFVVVWKLYMQVAGRVAMLTEAQEAHDWTVDFIPDESATGGTPAFVGSKETIYREFCEISDASGRSLGSKPGMASLKASGTVPPWEKLETAARGRAIGAWGFGVLPGSGIASLDEMELANYPDFQEEEPEPIRDRESIEHDLFIDVEQLRTVRNRDQAEINAYLRTIVYEVSGKEVEDKEGRMDVSGLTTPQLELVRRRVDGDLRKVRTQADPL